MSADTKTEQKDNTINATAPQTLAQRPFIPTMDEVV